MGRKWAYQFDVANVSQNRAFTDYVVHLLQLDDLDLLQHLQSVERPVLFLLHKPYAAKGTCGKESEQGASGMGGPKRRVEKLTRSECLHKFVVFDVNACLGRHIINKV